MAMNADGTDVTPIATCEEGGQFPDWWQPSE
jgi:hypothetical protein